jgi:ABC-2 family transporter
MSSSYLLQSSAAEKQNRVIEVLLSSLEHEELLAGKVLGLGLVGLLHAGVYAILIGLPLTPILGSGNWMALLLSPIYLILGYLCQFDGGNECLFQWGTGNEPGRRCLANSQSSAIVSSSFLCWTGFLGGKDLLLHPVNSSRHHDIKIELGQGRSYGCSDLCQHPDHWYLFGCLLCSQALSGGLANVWQATQCVRAFTCAAQCLREWVGARTQPLSYPSPCHISRGGIARRPSPCALSAPFRSHCLSHIRRLS